MKLGAMIGGAARAELEKQIERAERREMERKRQREINRRRRQGKTVRYDRRDDR